MPSYLTSDSLIASIKRRASIPTSQSTFEDDDFLAFANEELAIGIVPSILQYHEEYLVYEKQVPLLANTTDYPLPERAIGSKLRAVHFQDANGNLYPMTRIDLDDKPYYQNSGTPNYLTYSIRNNFLVTATQGSSPSGYLLMSYYLRPNQLVSELRASTITAIASTSIVIDAVLTSVTEYTVDGVPTVFSTSLETDIIEAKGGHRSKQLDATPASIDTTSKKIYYLPANVPDDVSVGDVITLAGESIIPQIPDDLHSVLAQRVAARCIEALGDVNNLNAANAKLAEMELKTGNIIDNRVEGDPLKVINLRGLFRTNRRHGRWRY